MSRALPSFSVMEIMPVSAMAKFAPVMPIVGGEIFFPEHAPGDHREFLRIVRRRVAEVALEQLP